MVLATRSAAFFDSSRYQFSRTLALAAAMSLNMGALLLLSLVGNVANFDLPAKARPVDTLVEWIVARPAPPVPVAPAIPRAPERPRAVSPTHPEVAPIQPAPPSEVVLATGTEIAAAESATAPGIDSPVAVVADREAGLAYGIAPPPRYPRKALQAGMQGTVMLAVLVAPDGSVEQVRVETSSGHRLLDLHAQRHVKDHWRFQPAWRGGRAVAAWALVPVEFRTDR